MAVYKIVDSEKLDKDLKGIANTIRSRGGTTENFTFPEGFKSAIRNIPQEGGDGSGGSGIIDVTELPTSGIDENAVYRVTEEVIVRSTNAFLVIFPGVVNSWFTLEGYLENQGIYPETINVFDVEELPPVMEPSDVVGYSVLNFYLSRADGKCYLYIAEYGMAVSIGYLLGDQSLDKGSLENLLDATEAGIYTTFEATEEFSRYFVRENFEWKEITAYVNMTNIYQLGTPSLVTGDVTKRMFGASMLLSHQGITEICEEWFLKSDGSYVDYIENQQFCHSSIVEAVIPACIEHINSLAFQYSSELKTITFKGTPSNVGIANNAFQDCPNITTINVPWSEGEILNAPWGAPSGCTINYNCNTEG